MQVNLKASGRTEMIGGYRELFFLGWRWVGEKVEIIELWSLEMTVISSLKRLL